MAGGDTLTPVVETAGGWSRVAGRFWRAVPAGREAGVLEGTARAGRYNRPGQRTLYVSASRDGVAAAMVRYGGPDRPVVALDVAADRLIDLRDADACASTGSTRAASRRTGSRRSIAAMCRVPGLPPIGRARWARQG